MKGNVVFTLVASIVFLLAASYVLLNYNAPTTHPGETCAEFLQRYPGYSISVPYRGVEFNAVPGMCQSEFIKYYNSIGKGDLGIAWAQFKLLKVN